MAATFIYNNYVQATWILKELPVILNRLIVEMGINNMIIFEGWLHKEWEYLKSLKKEPPVETIQMEYYQKLLNLWASKWVTRTDTDLYANQYLQG